MKIIDYHQFKKCMCSAYANLENNKEMINSLNVFPVPDGDTGTNMALTVKYAVKEMNESESNSVHDAASSCSSGALMGARGNSGVILSQLFRGFSKGVRGVGEATVVDIALALKEASTMAYKAVMKPTEGTILTVSRYMGAFAEENAYKYEDIIEFLQDVIKEGNKALALTPSMLKVLEEAGVVDAGGKGLMILLEGAMSALKGNEITVNENNQEAKASAVEYISNLGEEINFKYCTEFLIISDKKKNYEKYLLEKLYKLGDCLLVVGDEKYIKIHVHTNEPWVAMKIASGCGELSKIKIENMKEQHTANFVEDKKPKYSKEEVDYVIIGVSAGEGLSQILSDLGVSYIIEGGQTMNPSTQDFMDIIDATNAKNYLILPNNKNIILAAEQAKKLSKKTIEVIPTKTVPEAISSLIEFDETADIGTNLDNMAHAIGYIKTGQVTFAVRDSISGDITIKKDDIIGISGSDIVVSTKDIVMAVDELLESMIDKNTSLITLYYGVDVTDEQNEIINNLIDEKYTDYEVNLEYGGQPLYYYIISIE